MGQNAGSKTNAPGGPKETMHQPKLAPKLPDLEGSRKSAVGPKGWYSAVQGALAQKDGDSPHESRNDSQRTSKKVHHISFDEDVEQNTTGPAGSPRANKLKGWVAQLSHDRPAGAHLGGISEEDDDKPKAPAALPKRVAPPAQAGHFNPDTLNTVGSYQYQDSPAVQRAVKSMLALNKTVMMGNRGHKGHRENRSSTLPPMAMAGAQQRQSQPMSSH